jgi:cytochrome c553
MRIVSPPGISMKRLGFTSAAALLALPLAALAQPASPAPDRSVRDNISTCTGCHGIPGYQAALQAYKKGERSHPTMRAIAGGLSDKEIAEVAAYYAARGAGASVAAK